MISIIDYGAGNTRSVANALKSLGVEFVLTDSIGIIKASEKIIFPGVGQASYAMKRLEESGLIPVLKNSKVPVLGVCLGMQLLTEFSEEGNTTGLGIFPGNIIKFEKTELAVPHIGWNQIEIIKESKLLKDISDGEFFYFAHSYYFPANEFSTSITEYGLKVSSSIEYNNFFGVQFHPEKSSAAGLKLIRNFVEL